jgi:protein tyrosine/serine phosphatase
MTNLPIRTQPGLCQWTPLAGITLLLGCGLAATDGFAWLRPTDNFHVIKDGQAYRSGQLDGESFKFVFDINGIRTVINLRGENPDELWYQQEVAATLEKGVTLANIPMSAKSLPSRETLLAIYDTITTAEYPILIHCQAGADRTGAVSAIWRMVILGEPREAAQAELSLWYGHFQSETPMMDELVRIFEPDRDWILNEYPAP